MKKPIGIHVFGILYLILGILVVIGYFYLVFTDWAVFTFEAYDAGDVIYSAEAAEFVGKYVLGPVIFLGGLVALPGGILILLRNPAFRRCGYYLMLIASVCWTLPAIGLITITYLLTKNVKDYSLGAYTIKK